jgi:hypothetical protein
VCGFETSAMVAGASSKMQEPGRQAARATTLPPSSRTVQTNQTQNQACKWYAWCLNSHLRTTHQVENNGHSVIDSINIDHIPRCMHCIQYGTPDSSTRSAALPPLSKTLPAGAPLQGLQALNVCTCICQNLGRQKKGHGPLTGNPYTRVHSQIPAQKPASSNSVAFEQTNVTLCC